MKHLLCLFFLAFLALPLNAQTGDWLTDSLEYYDDKIEEASEARDDEAVFKYIFVIMKEAEKSLEPAFYDWFERAAKNEAFHENDEIRARIHLYLGTLEFYRSNYSAASRAFSTASKYYKKAGNVKYAAGVVMNQGVILERANEYIKAIEAYNKALDIFIETQDTSAIASCFENIALAQKRFGNNLQALKYIRKTDSVLKMQLDPESPRWVSFYYNQGQIYKAAGKVELALASVLKGLRQSEEIQNIRQINFGYLQLLDIYDNKSDSANWLKYARQATEFYQRTNNIDKLCDIFNRIATFYLENKNIDKAQYFASKNLKVSIETTDSTNISVAYFLQGNIDYSMEKYNDALKELIVALDYNVNDTKLLRADIFYKMGGVYMHLGGYSKADEYLLKSLEIRKSKGDWTELKESYETLAINMEKQARYKEAYNYHKLFKQYQDSIFANNKSEQITKMQTQFDTEYKDKEIAAFKQQEEIQKLKSREQDNITYASFAGLGVVFILASVFYNRSRLKQRANVALTTKNNEIAARDKEKETLLKEIHHRVKNNLQVISSLLSMQSRGQTDEKVKDAVKEGQSRVKTMALIHERLYQYDNLSQIAMKDYMQQLSEFLQQTYAPNEDIKIVIDAKEDINLDIDTAVPLGLITNELLSNALKYAFEGKESGEIKLLLCKTETNGYRLVVSDTGKGLDADLDIEKTKSLGLKLVRTLTRQIDGTLDIKTDQGTTFSIEFEDKPLAA